MTLFEVLGFDAEDVAVLSRRVYDNGFKTPDQVLKMSHEDLAACGFTLGAIKHFEGAARELAGARKELSFSATVLGAAFATGILVTWLAMKRKAQ